jgi:hypothetical protein
MPGTSWSEKPPSYFKVNFKKKSYLVVYFD